MSWISFVLFLHIVAACVWIGGQITVAILIPALKGHPELVSAVGQRFQRAAWVAYGFLILTGILNVYNLGIGWSGLVSTPPGRLVLDKLGFVALSGIAAAVHALILAPRRRERMSARAFSAWAAILGSISLLAALAAALYGVVIAHGG